MKRMSDWSEVIDQGIWHRCWTGIAMVYEKLKGRSAFWDYYDPSQGEMLMRYAGRIDKDGDMMYEGDIWSTSFEGDDEVDAWEPIIIGPILWNADTGMFNRLPTNDEDSIYNVKYAKVVGNVFENPELIESIDE